MKNLDNYIQKFAMQLTVYKNFRGVHLKDLISLHTAFPDYVEDGLINVSVSSNSTWLFFSRISAH